MLNLLWWKTPQLLTKHHEMLWQHLARGKPMKDLKHVTQTYLTKNHWTNNEANWETLIVSWTRYNYVWIQDLQSCFNTKHGGCVLLNCFPDVSTVVLDIIGECLVRCVARRRNNNSWMGDHWKLVRNLWAFKNLNRKCFMIVHYTYFYWYIAIIELYVTVSETNLIWWFTSLSLQTCWFNFNTNNAFSISQYISTMTHVLNLNETTIGRYVFIPSTTRDDDRYITFLAIARDDDRFYPKKWPHNKFPDNFSEIKVLRQMWREREHWSSCLQWSSNDF